MIATSNNSYQYECCNKTNNNNNIRTTINNYEMVYLKHIRRKM